MATASRSDALYVKFKPNSPFTVNREAVDFMAQHFAQDTTFVTHFALARLRDDIQAGLLNTANTLPVVASVWLSGAQTDAVRADVAHRFQPADLVWQENSPALASALEQM